MEKTEMIVVIKMKQTGRTCESRSKALLQF